MRLNVLVFYPPFSQLCNNCVGNNSAAFSLPLSIDEINKRGEYSCVESSGDAKYLLVGHKKTSTWKDEGLVWW
jgi:hypothetical protein